MSQRNLLFQAHNLKPLKNTHLKHYLEAILPLSEIITQLQARGLFKNVSKIDYTMAQFLKEKGLDENPVLKFTAVEMIKANTALHPSLMDPTFHCPKEFSALKPKISFYLDVIHDVLNNQLAQRMYEAGVPEHENVSERQHALQAAKIASLLKLSNAEILALGFHDIARMTHDNESHGHANHGKEGDDITQPLGFSVDYSYLHTFAKQLLFEFCPPYKELISPVSAESLKIQTEKFVEQAMRLEVMPAEALMKCLCQIMLMRLIDDMSKVPDSLALDTSKEALDKTLQRLLPTQMEINLRKLALQADNETEMLEQFEQKLDVALALLTRAKDYSKNPTLYSPLIFTKKIYY